MRLTKNGRVRRDFILSRAAPVGSAGPAAGSSTCLAHRVLEKDLPVAGEILDQRQGGGADGASLGSDGAGYDFNLAQSAPVETLENMGRAGGQPVAHARRHRAV